jgi:hypothetical protein
MSAGEDNAGEGWVSGEDAGRGKGAEDDEAEGEEFGADIGCGGAFNMASYG